MRFGQIVLLALVMMGFASNSSAQISPGDLATPHAHLEGVSNCTKCHTVGNKVNKELCLDCHKEIKSRIIAKKGFHSSREVEGKECVVCHNDHHGRNFKLIHFEKDKFDHQLTGFELKGKHLNQNCKDCGCTGCHKPANIKDPEIKKKTSTYLGLTQECTSCHEDFHQGKMASNCTNCHGFTTFKGATGFDHSTSKFPLIGQHKKVACEKCHKPEIVSGKKTQTFKGLAFNNCTNCHIDVHKNKFGQECTKCHSEESFHNVKGISTFNHDKTSFQLIGKHNTVNCKSCHKISLTTPLKHDVCSDCHTDYHKKEFARNGKNPDCSDCHNHDGFTPSLFTIERHNLTKFKLDGSHLATPCFSCHKKQPAWNFRNIGIACVDCHNNEHKGFIQDKYYPIQSCPACHQTSHWKDISFDHGTTNFKLEGTHLLTNCAKCHYPGEKNKLKSQKFKGLSTSCEECHTNSHAGQFDENGRTDCTRCHGYENWTKSIFDHNSARFKLEGVHKQITCAKCHPEVINAKGKYIEYKNNKLLCSDCHRSL
ncbi:MAG: hypothetical protein WCK18_03145 [Prolixibacteraceae bacterium]